MRTLCKALIMLRNKDLISPAVLLELFFELLRCQDKLLRKTLYTHIVTDIKNINAKHKNNKVNTNFMYTMLRDNNTIAAKMSLDVMIELYRRNIWNDAKTVNVITTACFSKVTKILVAALQFFLGKDNEKKDSDSESEDEGPTARDLMVRYATGKKNTKSKKKLEKAMKVLKFHLPYLFSPLPLLPSVIRKIKIERVPAILVAADWPRRSWYADLGQLLARARRPSLPGPDLPPELGGPEFNGLAVESWILTQARFSQKVAATMISARKPASARIYHHTWKVFFAWCRERFYSPLRFSIPNILVLLQAGLDSGLAPSTLKRQITALSVLVHCRIATNWDLKLILGVLQESPFEPLQDIH
ncbi:unnamed protein product [Ranitomeya imitator]|uniref:Protein SDA1 n=1 Tax=Ranitomeya imitator TaxID=111125 RepID=A0ABN9LGM2_9NEOB|nr:unnamed protein product [Ranitomeya imitator]